MTGGGEPTGGYVNQSKAQQVMIVEFADVGCRRCATQPIPIVVIEEWSRFAAPELALITDEWALDTT